MDIMVTPADAARWILTDLLGRQLGSIACDHSTFEITPEGIAIDQFGGMKLRPFESLDSALAKIERHMRGTCRLAANA